MARPQKKGLDYFPLDVDLFADQKIKILKSRFGTDGIAIYIYLLCEIYKNGYYIKMDEDYEYVLKDDLNLNDNVVSQIMEFLFNRSLLVRKLVKSDTFITSKAVQRRFQEAIKLRKKPVIVKPDLWLLSEEETLGCIKVNINPDNSEIKPSLSKIKPDNSEIKPTKESKGKESKGNKRKSNNNVPSADKSADSTETHFISLILNDKSFYNVTVEDVNHYRELYPAVDVAQELRSMCGWLEGNPTKRKTRSGIKGFITRWLSKSQNQGGVGYGGQPVPANNRQVPDPGTTSGYQTKNIL